MAARYRDEIALLAKGESFPDDIFYVPFLACCSLLDFMPENALLVLDELADIATAEEEHDLQSIEIRDEMTARCELPAGMPFPHKPWPELRDALTARRSLVDLSRWASGEEGETSIRLPFAAAAAYGGRFLDLTNDLAGASARRQTTVVVSQQAATDRRGARRAGHLRRRRYRGWSRRCRRARWRSCRARCRRAGASAATAAHSLC